MITVAVVKVPWENIASVSLRRNPWNKVLSKPFRITETSNCRRKKICRSCCLHDGILNALMILNDGTLKHQKYTYRKRQRFHLHLLLQQANDHFSSFLVCKAKILVSRTLSTCRFYCLRCSLFCFRLNSSIRNKTGTHVFWENGVDYPRVSSGAHPLAKKPKDSGYEIVFALGS